MKALIAGGADPNIPNNDGDSPMKWAGSWHNKQALANAGGRQKAQRGSGIWETVFSGAIAAGVAVSAGADAETTLDTVEAVVTGKAPERLPEEPVARDEEPVMSQEERELRLAEQERARQVEAARRAKEAEAERRATMQRRNADVLNSDCKCISVDDGEYRCLDGFGSDKAICDIRR